MHGNINATIAQGGFQFGRKQPFAADLGQWFIQDLVALCHKWLDAAF
jgi:hypothetical protein